MKKYWIIVKNGDKLFEATEEHLTFNSALMSAKRKISNREDYMLAIQEVAPIVDIPPEKGKKSK